MTSIIEGYEYDIFISYRQNDNKRDKWVTQFVEALKDELDATIKNSISIYFDENPHDGLLETHDVDDSLKEKIKCLIFIPIISRTYCDTNGYAWRSEFLSFLNFVKQDSLGLKIKGKNGNVNSRILPIRIHELNLEDISLFEKESGGVMRGVDFVFQAPGVNRPLAQSDKKEDNLNRLFYRDQINKVANAIHDIIYGSKIVDEDDKIITNSEVSTANDFKKSSGTSRNLKFTGGALAVIILSILLYWAIPFGSNVTKSDVEKSLAVLPFKSLSNGTDDGLFADGLTEELIYTLSGIPDLLVTGRVSSFYYKDHKVPLEEIANTLRVNHLVEGSVRRIGDRLRITVQIVRVTDGINLWSEAYDEPVTNILSVQKSIAQNIARALDIVLDDVKSSQMHNLGVNNVDAFIAFQKGFIQFRKAHGSDHRNEELLTATAYFDEAINLVPSFSQAYQLRSDYFAHTLLETVNPGSEIPKNESDSIFKKYNENIENAILYSRDRGSTLLYKSDLVVFSEDWSSLKGIISQLLQSTTCDRPNWIQNLLYTHSQSDPAIADYFVDRINCDPLREENYQMAAIAYMNAGLVDEGLNMIEKGLKMPFSQTSSFILFYIKGLLLNASGRHDEAAQIQTLNVNEKEMVFESIRYSALMSDTVAARKKWDENQSNIDWEEVDKIRFNAIIGNREEANRIAARIDTKPYGSLYLTTIARYCLCGAPFDIDKTPNFKKRIKEAGITWPPASPIEHPLKDW